MSEIKVGDSVESTDERITGRVLSINDAGIAMVRLITESDGIYVRPIDGLGTYKLNSVRKIETGDAE